MPKKKKSDSQKIICGICGLGLVFKIFLINLSSLDQSSVVLIYVFEAAGQPHANVRWPQIYL